MKSIINILLLVLMALSLQAQRDTLDYSTTFDSDTITGSHSASDSSFTFRYTLDGVTYTQNWSYVTPVSFQDSLDSIRVLIDQYIEAKKIFVEQYYRLYQQTNSELWNLQRQYARLEEFIDALYNP